MMGRGDRQGPRDVAGRPFRRGRAASVLLAPLLCATFQFAGLAVAAPSAGAATITGPAPIGSAPIGSAASSPAPSTLTTLDGTYVVQAADGRAVEAEFEYLRVGRAYYRLVGMPAASAQPNDSIRVTGTLDGSDLTVSSVSVLPTLRGAAAASAAASVAPLPSSVSLLVILVKYGASAPTATQAQANDFVFNKVNRWYNDTSYGQLQFTGTTTPVLTIPDPGSCNWLGLAGSAEQAADAAGYNSSSYTKRMIVFPRREDCTFPGRSDVITGLAEIGSTHVWLNNGLSDPNDGYSFLGPVHELGHTLGLNHAHSLSCAPDALTLTCAVFGTLDDYGNSWDAMGTNWPGDNWGSVVEFSALSKQRLGWLSGRVAVAHPSQSIRIAPLEAAAPGLPQAIAISTPLHEYWIEFRQPTGPDAFLSHYPATTSGVFVNMRDDTFIHDNGPALLDMHPATAGDFADAALQPNESWTDPEQVFTLVVHPGDATGITVDVLAGQVTRPAAPSGVSATAGDTAALVRWNAPASNGGSAIVGSRVSVNGANPVLVAGASTSQLITGLTNGVSYTFTVEVQNSVGWSPVSTASAAIVPAAGAAKPTLPRNVTAIAHDRSVDLSWDAPASDGGAPITTYGVWSQPGHVLRTAVDGSTTHVTVSGLDNGTTYTFEVAAGNALNHGDAASSNTVVPFGVPDPPLNVVATPHDGSASVTWSAPASDRGSPITGYTIVPSTPGVNPIEVGPTTTSYLLVGVPNGTGISFTIAAKNAFGTGTGTISNSVVPTNPNQPNVVVKPEAITRVGYWMLDASGGVYAFGDAKTKGDARSTGSGTRTHLEPTPSGNGYWIIDATGTVTALGDAHTLGNAGRAGWATDERATSLSATPSGNGYWIFTNKGRVQAFGDATYYGDMSTTHLNGPVLGSIATPTGHGYWMVASDGGIFAFGDAAFHGSMGGRHLNAPVQSLVPTADNHGYWLVASDGGIFAFGNAAFHGSMGATHLNRPVVGMVRYGNGYLMVGADGGIFDFSDLAYKGSLGDNPPPTGITSVAALNG